MSLADLSKLCSRMDEFECFSVCFMSLKFLGVCFRGLSPVGGRFGMSELKTAKNKELLKKGCLELVGKIYLVAAIRMT